jgi:hypothetical protein
MPPPTGSPSDSDASTSTTSRPPSLRRHASDESRLWSSRSGDGGTPRLVRPAQGRPPRRLPDSPRAAEEPDRSRK